jgi:hypothetical protein
MPGFAQERGIKVGFDLFVVTAQQASAAVWHASGTVSGVGVGAQGQTASDAFNKWKVRAERVYFAAREKR